DRPLPCPLICEIAGHPVGIEFLLVEADPLEVVPRLATPEEQRRQPLASVRVAMLADRRERRHPEVERAVACLLSVEQQRRDQEIHHARRIRAIPHEIDRQLFAAWSLEQVGKGENPPLRACLLDNRAAASSDILAIEITNRELP